MGNERDFEAFGRALDRLQEDFFKAITYYEVWKSLFPTKERVAVLNRFKDFFAPVLSAAREMLLIHLAKLFDPDRRAISLGALIAAAESDASLIPHGNQEGLAEVRTRIESHRRAVRALRRARNQRLAHLDWDLQPKLPLEKGEFDALFADAKLALNTLKAMHDRSQWEWSLQERKIRTTSARVLAELGRSVDQSLGDD